MNCNVISDLMPLYIDGCCSEESRRLVEEHIEGCDKCKNLLSDMSIQYEAVAVPHLPKKFTRLNEWKASVVQSVILIISFLLIIIGVTWESDISSGYMDGFWASNLIVPATGFMLSLINWFFVRVYKSRRIFSNLSMLVTLTITICGYIWSAIHYFRDFDILYCWIGFLLTVIFCVLSGILSDKYAKMLGKE